MGVITPTALLGSLIVTILGFVCRQRLVYNPDWNMSAGAPASESKMVTIKENVLYGPVSDHFLEQGFFVFSGAQKREIVGTSEFGVKLDGKDETVDVLAVRWTETGEIHSVAVECKLYKTARAGAGAGLHQATDYQLFFDEVYVATQAGQLADKESVLRTLGLGHISVDLKSHKVGISFQANFRNANRFDLVQNMRQVTPRAVLPLIFKDVFGLPVRYMDASRGGLWVARDVVSKVQYNAGSHYDYRETHFAINIEFIEDLRQVVRKVDKQELELCLRNLDKKYVVELGIDEMRTDRRLATPIKSRADRVDVKYLLKEIAKGIRVPTSGRRKSKPHLIISAPFYKKGERLTRESYIERTREAIDRLTPLMEVFKACFEEEN